MKKWCLLVMMCIGCVAEPQPPPVESTPANKVDDALEGLVYDSPTHKVIEVNGQCFVVVSAHVYGGTSLTMAPVACKEK